RGKDLLALVLVLHPFDDDFGCRLRLLLRQPGPINPLLDEGVPPTPFLSPITTRSIGVRCSAPDLPPPESNGPSEKPALFVQPIDKAPPQRHHRLCQVSWQSRGKRQGGLGRRSVRPRMSASPTVLPEKATHQQ